MLELRRVDAGNLRAFAKVKLGCIVIHGCRVVPLDDAVFVASAYREADDFKAGVG